jgi:hypothetical protein
VANPLISRRQALSVTVLFNKESVNKKARGRRIMEEPTRIPANKFDPLTDPRWEEFVRAHPRSSVFHSTAWLSALNRTYGYIPVGFTTAQPDERLNNGAVFCLIDTWLYGRRLVSLPFSDHCDFLADDEADLSALYSASEQLYWDDNLLYIEVRPQSEFHVPTQLLKSEEEYCFHQLDLTPNLDTLFRSFHKNSTQRKIRRAVLENVTTKEGRSTALLNDFYDLFLLTRKRHGLPPQPRQWFRNLIECFGDLLEIRVAYKADQAIASILTIRYKDTLTYKYGCSDLRFNKLGGTHLLFWSAIQDAKKKRLKLFDFGRSNIRSVGLITFKERWGAGRSQLHYLTFTSRERRAGVFPQHAADWGMKSARRMFAHAPKWVLAAFGSIFYKQIG